MRRFRSRHSKRRSSARVPWRSAEALPWPAEHPALSLKHADRRERTSGGGPMRRNLSLSDLGIWLILWGSCGLIGWAAIGFFGLVAGLAFGLVVGGLVAVILRRRGDEADLSRRNHLPRGRSPKASS